MVSCCFLTTFALPFAINHMALSLIFRILSPVIDCQAPGSDKHNLYAFCNDLTVLKFHRIEEKTLHTL